MGGTSSREIIESCEKKIQDLENRVLELEQRVFLGATKDSHGNLIFENTIERRHDNTPSSSGDNEVNDIYSRFINSRFITSTNTKS
jgi:hypothetical protein